MDSYGIRFAQIICKDFVEFAVVSSFDGKGGKIIRKGRTGEEQPQSPFGCAQGKLSTPVAVGLRFAQDDSVDEMGFEGRRLV
jgi:hypothetical protein